MKDFCNIVPEVTDSVNNSWVILNFHKGIVFHFVGLKINQVPGGIADGFPIKKHRVQNFHTTEKFERGQSDKGLYSTPAIVIYKTVFSSQQTIKDDIFNRILY